MSEMERASALLNMIPQSKLAYVIGYLQGLTADEVADDAFCLRLYEHYQNDPEKDESFTLEECKREWELA